jgi:hypothetical protein
MLEHFHICEGVKSNQRARIQLGTKIQSPPNLFYLALLFLLLKITGLTQKSSDVVVIPTEAKRLHELPLRQTTLLRQFCVSPKSM